MKRRKGAVVTAPSPPTLPREMWHEILVHLLGASTIDFFAVQVVCKSFRQLCEARAPGLDWFGALCARDENFSRRAVTAQNDPGAPRMYRGAVYAVLTRPLLLERLKQLREKHSLVYRTKKGAIWRGEIGTRKMRKIEIKDPVLKKTFIGLIREHDRLSKSYNAVWRRKR